MQFSAVILSSAVFAALATAAPLEERAGLVTVNLYSDGSCAKKIQTLTLTNNTCNAATSAFSSVKVASNPQVAIGDAYTQAGCGNSLTKGFLLNNATKCINDFNNGPGKFIAGYYGNSS